MAALQHQKAAIAQYQPAARVGDVGQRLNLDLLKQPVAVDLANFDLHRSGLRVAGRNRFGQAAGKTPGEQGAHGHQQAPLRQLHIGIGQAQ